MNKARQHGPKGPSSALSPLDALVMVSFRQLLPFRQMAPGEWQRHYLIDQAMRHASGIDPSLTLNSSISITADVPSISKS